MILASIHFSVRIQVSRLLFAGYFLSQIWLQGVFNWVCRLSKEIVFCSVSSIFELEFSSLAYKHLKRANSNIAAYKTRCENVKLLKFFFTTGVNLIIILLISELVLASESVSSSSEIGNKENERMLCIAADNSDLDNLETCGFTCYFESNKISYNGILNILSQGWIPLSSSLGMSGGLGEVSNSHNKTQNSQPEFDYF